MTIHPEEIARLERFADQLGNGYSLAHLAYEATPSAGTASERDLELGRLIGRVLRCRLQSQEGWRVVPVEATEEMLDADGVHCGRVTARSAWNAMLAAAPLPAPVEGKKLRVRVNRMETSREDHTKFEHFTQLVRPDGKVMDFWMHYIPSRAYFETQNLAQFLGVPFERFEIDGKEVELDEVERMMLEPEDAPAVEAARGKERPIGWCPETEAPCSDLRCSGGCRASPAQEAEVLISGGPFAGSTEAELAARCSNVALAQRLTSASEQNGHRTMAAALMAEAAKRLSSPDVVEVVAASLAPMLIEYVDGGIASNQNWRYGLKEIIQARLRRLSALSPIKPPESA